MNPGHWGLARNASGHLAIGGVNLAELARTVGTPLHVVHEARLRENYRRFVTAFAASYPRVRVFYSYKTNCLPGVLAILHEEGCGAEVVSPYELWTACRLGVEPSRVIYNGVNKSRLALQSALHHASLINVDSLAELGRLEEVAGTQGVGVDVGLRISPGIGWKAQFGLSPEADAAIPVLRGVRERGVLTVCGLHAHIGTDVRAPELYRKAIDVLCRWAHDLKRRAGIDIRYVDIGGGFAVPTAKTFTLWQAALYRLLSIAPARPRSGACPSVEEVAHVVGKSLREGCRRYGIEEPELLLEPGRALTSDAQALLVTVHDLKQRRDGTRYAMTDGGAQHLAFPVSYEYHECLLASRVAAGDERRYFVTGPLCSPGDVLYRNWRLPALREGDILAIMDAGAYFTSFANNFSYPRPPVVVVGNDGYRLVRQRETFEHMAAMDMS